MSAQQQNHTVQFTKLGAPLAIVPGITGNVLTVVSFLIGTSSFIVGLRIQNATKANQQQCLKYIRQNYELCS